MPLKKIIGIVVVIMVIFGALGPVQRYDPPKLLDTEINIPLHELDQYVAEKELKIKDLKSDNQARIIWYDTIHKQKTKFALVYLHGFSASQKEGDPIHKSFAKRYGMNLYLPRLEDHGRADSNSFIHLTPENYLQSAEDAIDIAKLLGDNVIVMSCSTGGTLSAILASAGENIHSMIMYSPNIEIFDPMSDLLLYPWGKQLTNIVLDGQYNRVNYDSLAGCYWNNIYHTNALFVLKTLIRDNMNEVQFQKIKIPVFMGYYYKDETQQDDVVSVPRMMAFFDQINTPPHLKFKKSFPNAGGHIISSYVFSKDIEGVKKSTFDWAEKVLSLQPAQ